MKILLLGRNGQVGSELNSHLPGIGEVLSWGRDELDLLHTELIREKVLQLAPDVIVNAAAYTAVDKAESEPELAMAINGEAPGILAEAAARLGALLVHYSTDYVFDGSKRSPYTEQDATTPANEYGRSKLAGERGVVVKTGRYLIFRTEWVYGAHGKNFLNTIKRIGSQRTELRIVDDQTGSPTWSREIARATVQIIRRYVQRTDQEQASGIYHLTAGGQATWFDFAQAAAENGLFAGIEHPPALIPITTPEYPTPAKRPAYSVMSNAKLQEQFGVHLPDWKISLQECMREFG